MKRNRQLQQHWHQRLEHKKRKMYPCIHQQKCYLQWGLNDSDANIVNNANFRVSKNVNLANKKLCFIWSGKLRPGKRPMLTLHFIFHSVSSLHDLHQKWQRLGGGDEITDGERRSKSDVTSKEKWQRQRWCSHLHIKGQNCAKTGHQGNACEYHLLRDLI